MSSLILLVNWSEKKISNEVTCDVLTAVKIKVTPCSVVDV